MIDESEEDKRVKTVKSSYDSSNEILKPLLCEMTVSGVGLNTQDQCGVTEPGTTEVFYYVTMKTGLEWAELRTRPMLFLVSRRQETRDNMSDCRAGVDKTARAD